VVLEDVFVPRDQVLIYREYDFAGSPGEKFASYR
jgi:aromatic ring hydroxylase